MQKLFDIWADKNPAWEVKYEDSILRTFSDYGRGSSAFQEARGKIFGAGYELLIIAFFSWVIQRQEKTAGWRLFKTKSLGTAYQVLG